MITFLFFETLCYNPETLTMASTVVRFPPSPKMVSFIGDCAKMRVKLKVPIVKNPHSDPAKLVLKTE